MDSSKLPDCEVFRVADLPGDKVIVTLSASESLFRRNIFGIDRDYNSIKAMRMVLRYEFRSIGVGRIHFQEKHIRVIQNPDCQYVSLDFLICVSHIEKLFENIYVFQQDIPISVGCIQISLLASNLSADSATFMYEVYDSNRELGKLLFCKTVEVKGIIPGIDEKRAEIRSLIEKSHLNPYISEASVDSYMMNAYEKNVILLYSLLKYEYQVVDTMPIFQKLMIEKPFYISFGEYRAACSILYMKNEPMDIFEQVSKKNFDFYTFEELIYFEKRIPKLSFVRARFIKCIFKNSAFKEVDFTDASFEQCIFLNCTFENCLLSGSVFQDCTIGGTCFRNSQIESGMIFKDDTFDICRVAVMVGCLFDRNTEDEDYSKFQMIECRIEGNSDEK